MLTGRFYRRIVWLFPALLLIAMGGKTQTPVLDITPSGTMSVCSGTTIGLSANVANAFAGTTSYAVSNISFSPYSVTGTQLNMTDDMISGPLAIGFQFCFFGNTYTQFYLGSNGWIGFTAGQPVAFTATAIPSTSPLVPRNSIMGPWMDLNPEHGTGPYIRYQTQGTAPYRRLVVQWTNCPLYQCTSLNATLQIVLFESTNIIEHYITNKPTCAAWAGGTATQGLHNATGTVAVAVPGRNATVWNVTNDGKRFSPNGAPNYTINWTANGFPIGTGLTASHTAITNTRYIGRATFQCSNLILYDTLDVSIGGAASAAFSIPPVVCAGQPANFTYLGGAAGTGTWSFTGGSPSSASGLGTQSTTWASPGTYDVGLTVTPSSGSCSPGNLIQQVTVVSPPSSAFTIPASTCVNTAISLSYTGTVSPGATYSWNFGAGASPATAMGVGPHSVSWSTTGSKTVSLTVAAGSCSSVTNNNISITAAPTSTFSTSPATVCVGSNSTITFTGTAPGGSTYSWNFGTGANPATATGVGPHSVSWSSAGSKTVSLTVSGGGCSSNTSNPVTVNAIPLAAFTLPASVCQNTNAAITYSGGAPAPPAATYSWNFGAGASPATASTQGAHSVNWSTAGSKTVTLTVAQNGCTSPVNSQSITVHPTPMVTIGATPATVCTGGTSSLAITGTLPAAGSIYSWNFGAGASPATATGQGPHSVSWSSGGTKTVSLTVTTNGCASAAATASVTVNAPPAATATVPASGCVNSTIPVSAPGTFPGGTTFSWNFGAGASPATATGQGPHSVSWSSAGTKTVSLAVTRLGCSSNATGSINIQALPAAGITAPSTACQGQAVSVSGTTTTGATYSWNFGAGASPATATGAGPHSVTWSSTGSKTISYTVINNGCSNTGTQTLSVNAVVTSTFSAPAGICRGTAGTISYTGNAGGGATYSWNFGVGASPATATGQGPHSVSWSSAGAKTVSLTVTQSACSSTSSNPVTVHAIPTATISLPATACINGTVAAGISGSPLAGATYSWSFGAGANPATTTGAGPHNVSWTTAGTKTVSLTVTQNGCPATFTRTITLNALPSSAFALPAAVCAGAPAGISYTGGSGAGATYNWNFGIGASPATTTGTGPHSVIWSSAGSKSISLTVTENGCTSPTTTQTYTVKTIPSATFTLSNPGCINNPVTAAYTGGAGAGATYNWNFGVGASPATTTGIGPHSVNWSSAGTKTASLTVTENGCTSPAVNQSTVIQSPPSFTISSPTYTAINVETTVTYTGSQPPGATYNWNFNGGTIVSGSGAGPYVITWSTAGSKNITCSVTVNGCPAATQSTSTQVVPGAIVSFTAQSPVCTGETSTVQFTGTTFLSPTFAWNFGSGASPATATGQGPHAVSWSSPGTKTISLVVTDAGISSAPYTQQVTVYAIPTAGFSLPATACSGRDVNVSYTGNAGAGATYNWNFGAGASLATATGQGPHTINWSSAGTKTVSLSVSENGCSSNSQQTVDVGPTPTATFSTDVAVCHNDASTLSHTGTAGASASFNWDFGTGTHVSGGGPGPVNISWPQAGNTTVSLSVSENGCVSDPYSLPVTVKARPAGSFSITTGNCAGDTAHMEYTGAAGTGASYNWNFGAGANPATTTGMGPHSVSWATPGTKMASLIVTENGCSSSETQQSVTLHSKPVATFTLNDTIYVSQQATASFTGTAAAGSSFTWEYPSAVHVSGSGPGPLQLAWNAPGTYTVSLQIGNNGCHSLPVSHSIVVLPIPSSEFFVSNDSICTHSTALVNYAGSPSVQADYTWGFDGATVLSGSGAGPYQLQWEAAGEKHISLQVSVNEQSSVAWSHTVIVIQVPAAPFSIPQQACAGAAVLPGYTGTTSSNNQFQWTVDDGTVVSGGSTGQPEIRWDIPGTKTVSLSVADAMCISTLEVRTITVYQIPTASFDRPGSACVNAPVTLQYSGNASPNATYTWQFDRADVQAGSQAGPYELAWSAPGDKHISLQVSENGCHSPVNDTIITVHQRPLADAGTDRLLCSGDTIQFQAYEQAGYSYKWQPGGALNSDTLAAPLLTMQTIHSYVQSFTMRLTVYDGYCYNTDSLVIDVAPKPEAAFNLPGAQCYEGNSFDFAAGGSFTDQATFSWDFGPHAYSHTPYERNQQDISFDTPGYHPVSLRINQFGCASNLFTDSVLVHANPTASFTGSPLKGCIPLTTRFQGASSFGGTATYTWDFGDGKAGGGPSPSHTYNWSGYMTVSLTVRDSNGCTDRQTVENYVVALERPVAGFKTYPDVAFIGGEPLQLTNLSQNAQYSYYIIDNDTILGATTSYNFREPGMHTITQVVINMYGCQDETSRQVRAEYGTSYYIPSAFSPNFDGKNDEFRVEGENISRFSLVIFDRWGNELWKSNDISQGWDGMARNSTIPLPEGVYTFYLEMTDSENREIVESGQINLFR